MFNEYTEMFKPVCDYMKTTSELLPFGQHPTLLRNCTGDSQFLFHEALLQAELDAKQMQKAEKVCEFVHNIYEQFLEKAVNPEWTRKTIEERKAQIAILCARPQVEQRSEAWYKQTANVLTASEFSTLFSSARQRGNLIQTKVNMIPKEYLRQLAFPTSEISALTWGIRFEPVIKQILEKKWSAEIKDLGRLTHPTDEHLAASPDGLIISTPHRDKLGRLIEIKCPFSRKIGGDIPFDYWVQMQIQMECAEVDECEYVEAEILSLRSDMPTVDLTACQYKGTILLWMNETDGRYDYEYIGLDTKHEEHLLREGWKIVETIPWGIHKLHTKVVQRDRTWFQSTEPWRQSFWTDMERARKGEPWSIPAPAPLPEKVKPKICLIRDEE